MRSFNIKVTKCSMREYIVWPYNLRTTYTVHHQLYFLMNDFSRWSEKNFLFTWNRNQWLAVRPAVNEGNLPCLIFRPIFTGEKFRNNYKPQQQTYFVILNWRTKIVDVVFELLTLARSTFAKKKQRLDFSAFTPHAVDYHAVNSNMSGITFANQSALTSSPCHTKVTYLPEIMSH